MIELNYMKTKEIIEIADYLTSKFTLYKNQIVDFWDADNCAFGFSTEDKSILIYISTFNRKINHYYLEIDYQNADNEIFENISCNDLMKILQPIFEK